MLLQHNLHFIIQAIDLLSELSSEDFTKPSPLLNSGGIGPHIRHCIEHYYSLFQGLHSGKVDYDARERDRKMETDIHYAIESLRQIQSFLETVKMDESTKLDIKMETDSDEEHVPIWVSSSFGRELMSLISHTVHHFAIIALLLNHFGLPVPKGFGVAPSTLKYQAQLTS